MGPILTMVARHRGAQIGALCKTLLIKLKTLWNVAFGAGEALRLDTCHLGFGGGSRGSFGHERLPQSVGAGTLVSGTDPRCSYYSADPSLHCYR